MIRSNSVFIRAIRQTLFVSVLGFAALHTDTASAVCSFGTGGADLTLDTVVPCLDNTDTVGTVTVTSDAQPVSHRIFAPTIILNDASLGTVTINSISIPNTTTLNLGIPAFLVINYGLPGVANVNVINNAGNIFGQWYGIYNEGLISSLSNTGTLSFDEGSLINFSGGNIETITNTGIIGISNLVTSVAINNDVNSTIETIQNTGQIYGIQNFGRIGTINNGGQILRYDNSLPVNYNIIIQSPTNYGVLSALGGVSGVTKFGIYPGSSVLAGTYVGVLQGISASNIDTATLSGTFGRYGWQLSDVDGNLSWDLLFWRLGPNAENTLSALTTSAYQVRDQLNARAAMMTTLLGYDTNTFGPNNVSIQFVARYNSVFSETNQGAGALVAAYRFAPSFRVGAFIDYAPWNSTPVGIQQNDNQPSFGAFAVYEQNPDLTGFIARGAIGYNKGRLTVTRSALLEDTEPGSGRADITAFGLGAEVGYGFRISREIVAAPYLGFRYTNSGRSSYTEWETDIVTSPLTYNTYAQLLTTGTVGVRFQGMAGPQFGYFISLGAEYDLARTMDTYSGTSSIDGLETFAVSTNSNANRLRGAGAVGLSYRPVANQKLSAEVGVRQLAYSADPSISALVKYSVGF